MNLNHLEKDLIISLIYERTQFEQDHESFGKILSHQEICNLQTRMGEARAKTMNLYVIREVLSNLHSGQFICIADEQFWKVKCRSLFTVAIIQCEIKSYVSPTLEQIYTSVSRYLEEYDKAIEGGHYEVIRVSDEEKERVVSYVWGAG